MSFLPSVISQHFQERDPILFKWIDQIAAFELAVDKKSEIYFEELCSSIISQQLSTHVADVIWGRFIKLFPGQKILPELVLQLTEVSLRAVGLSFAKIKYVKDLAEKVINGELDLGKLSALTDEQIMSNGVDILYMQVGCFLASLSCFYSIQLTCMSEE